MDTATFSLTCPKEIYDRETLLSVIYKFSNIATFEMSDDHTDFSVTCTDIKFGTTVTTLKADFLRELHDQQLRRIIAQKTKNIGDILLAQTFNNISLIDPEGEQSDYRDDPLNICNTAE